MARPKKEINEQVLKKLTRLHLSDKVIADVVGVHVDTLHSRYSDQMELWRSESKGKIAEVLWDEALTNREPWALKAVAQRHLGYADRVQSEVDTNIKAEVTVKQVDIQDRIKQIKGKE